jgi:macrodomain Ter protein organizer (MatP/YcbG family)
MNELLKLVKKENSLYALAAIAHACDNGGVLNASAEEYRIIVSSYLTGLIAESAKTPENTMSSTLYHKKAKYYFDKISTQLLELKDKSSLLELQSAAVSRLDSRRNKTFSKIKAAVVVAPKFTHLYQIENQYKDIDNFVKNELEPALEKSRFIAVHAPIKSGKKIIKQTIAIRGQSIGNREYKVFSSLNRKDCKSQREEYKFYGIEYCLVDQKKSSDKYIKNIRSLLDDGKEVIIMHDESDYGTGYKQIIADLYKTFIANKNVKFIGFSASNEELIFSDVNPTILTYCPPANYCGAKYLISKNNVFEAEPFFDDSSANFLSEQGQSIIDDFVKSNKKFLIVRLASGFPDYVKNTDTLLKLINESYNGSITRIEPVDQKNSWDWGDDGHWRRFDHDNNKTIVVVCQTASRSVEFSKAFLRTLYAMHDYRGSTCSFATKIQAMLRLAHFKQSKEDDDINPILYGCYESVELAANLEQCKDLSKKQELYSAYSKKLGTRVGNNNKGFDYKLVKFGTKPNSNDIKIACDRLGIQSITGYYIPKYRNIGQSNTDDLAMAIMNVAARSTNYSGGIPVYHIDHKSPNPNYSLSFDKLLNNGYKIGEYVALIPYKSKSHITSNKSIYQNLSN